jgi:CheY-like chemotaxis protein
MIDMHEPPRGLQRRVLFVDDEANVLSALQRMLRPLRDECRMFFARGGAEALDVLATAPFDIIITDMRMAGMDGAELLDEVSRRHPRTARIVLSGQADAEAILRVAGPAHQYLSKPCDPGKLKATLRRVFALRDLLDDEVVESSITRIRALPVLRATLDGLQTELVCESPSLGRISRIVERDIAAAAKLLQIVNSAFFGSHGAVCHVERAVHLLGADLLRGLVLSSGLLVEMGEDVARRIEEDGTYLGPDASRAMTCAGIGRVVLACCGLLEPGVVRCTPRHAK